MSESRSCRRPEARLLALLMACTALTLYTRRLRPTMLTWGATPEETAAAYPGDELVSDADGTSTMATTLPAPPEKVWPWLVQMGGDRAGWYSWDRLDHFGEPSADHVVPEWQDLKEGQRLPSVQDGRAWFTVARLEPNRTLVLRSDLNLASGRSFDPGSRSMPSARLDGIWGFHLRPAPFGETRLVVRTRGQGRPRWLVGPFDLLLGEPAHFVMQTRQFHNLRVRLDERR
jgi:proline iminopeptidase